MTDNNSKFVGYTTRPIVGEQIGIDRTVGYIMIHVEDEVRIVSNLEPASFETLLRDVLKSLPGQTGSSSETSV